MVEHRGWHSRGYLPHFDPGACFQSITFRLADSLPREKLAELAVSLPKEQVAERRRQMEHWLDQGAGSCLLRDPRCAAIAQSALLHDDGARYRLLAWCVMPNHVHLLIEVFAGRPLDVIIQAIKSVSAHRINRLLGLSGRLWQPEYFDRFIRNHEHFVSEVEYIENNPVAAGLCRLAEDWPYSSADWRRGGTALQIER